METIAKAVRRSGNMGLALPDPYPTLRDNEAMKVRFRRGGVTMMAAPPGGYKSTLALNMAIKWAFAGLVVLYVAADSDPHTVAKRCAGIITGDPGDYAEKHIREPHYQEALREIAPRPDREGGLYWEFRALRIEQIDDRVVAVEKRHGRKPDVVFVDNLMNMCENPTDYQGQQIFIRDADEMATAASCGLIVLHHTHEREQKKQKSFAPQPIWEIHNKVSALPRLILTLGVYVDQATESGMLSLANVKHTNGPSDRSGQTFEQFIINTANYRITDIPTVEA